MEICDQVVEKGRSVEVRKRILEKGDIGLKEAMEIAQAFEVASAQTKAMRSDVVAQITARKENVFQGKLDSSSFSGIKCYRCGYRGHVQSDEKCPAKDKECTKCHKRGHFAAMCRMQRAEKYGDGSDRKETKPSNSANYKDRRKSTTVKQLDGDAADSDNEYAFALRDEICVRARRIYISDYRRS
ncbi:transposon ty3-i gap-pol polyprotein [Lasius niger]|uniref:Transposon ty3-i gap-pol polyprotein n=1 Tax=Lasius niger TaxID=67767 RepID=A0A0J7K0H2_LASNI|nr:transposon ty3-i gap-pol polyprotein [Lasius niger]